MITFRVLRENQKKTWNIKVKDEEFIDFFFEFGVGEMKEEAYDKAKKFVCRIYGHKKIHKVDELRSMF